MKSGIIMLFIWNDIFCFKLNVKFSMVKFILLYDIVILLLRFLSSFYLLLLLNLYVFGDVELVLVLMIFSKIFWFEKYKDLILIV